MSDFRICLLTHDMWNKENYYPLYSPGAILGDGDRNELSFTIALATPMWSTFRSIYHCSPLFLSFAHFQNLYFSVFTDLINQGWFGFNQDLTTNSKPCHCKFRVHLIINNPVRMLCYTMFNHGGGEGNSQILHSSILRITRLVEGNENRPTLSNQLYTHANVCDCLMEISTPTEHFRLT